MDTIFALATARGKAGVAVIRISGPQAFFAVARLAGKVPPSRRATLRTLRGSDGITLDQALVLCFEKGQSFTGEDVVELQVHGSAAVTNAIQNELGHLDGLRVADPGEFTRRALENGCLDLAQVEGLGDLIEAETEAQRRQAMRLFSGSLGQKAESWRKTLIRAAALLEATIDFSDEDVPVDVTPEVLSLLDNVCAEFRLEIKGSVISERIRDGFEVAIVGAPNVGKSTLLNALAGRQAAIISEFAGTTRDVIEVRMDLNGFAVTFLDTAGLRTTTDVVEKIGIERGIERARLADVRVFLVREETEVSEIAKQPGDIVAVSKIDLAEVTGFGVSGKTGKGLDELTQNIATTLERRAAGAGTLTRARHRQALDHALFALDAATRRLKYVVSQPELIAEDIRSAIRALESLVGRIDTEDVLDEVFANFCLGK